MLKINEMLDEVYKGQKPRRQNVGGLIADFSAGPLPAYETFLVDTVMEYNLNFKLRARIQKDQNDEVYAAARRDVANHIHKLIYKSVVDDLIDLLLEVDGMQLYESDPEKLQEMIKLLIKRYSLNG